MNPEEYQVMRSFEDRHWWYRGLKTILTARLDTLFPLPPTAVLDAGCGTGGNLRLLRKHFPRATLTGVDVSPLALTNSSAPGDITLILGDVNRLDLPDASFDLVFSANVLSHENACPGLALAEFFRVLRPGGILLLNLPALSCLRGEHDAAVREVRRFHSPQLRGQLLAAGFGEVDCHYWNCLLTLPLWLRRQWTRHRGNRGPRAVSDLAASGGLLNGPLGHWITAETRLAARRRLPFGSSLFASARKPMPFNTLPSTP